MNLRRVGVGVRAIGFEEFGGPEVLRVFDRPTQHPGPGEVRIRVRAATVNPTDALTRSGPIVESMAALEPPYALGWEVAGWIDEVGEGSLWAVGDEVMAIVVPFTPRGGAYAEQVVVPADQVARVPAGLSVVAAATIPMNAVAAELAVEALQAKAGDTIAVTGAAGAVGGYAVELARAAGFRVVADASEADEELIRELGAHQIVRRGPEVANHIRAVVPEGVTGLVDASAQRDQAAPAIADGGVIALLRGWDEDPGRGIRKEPIAVRSLLGRPEYLERLQRVSAPGVLRPRIARTYGAQEAAEAHRVLESGANRGRLVLTF